MKTATGQLGTAEVQGRLWGGRAHDWANLQEPVQRTYYEHAFGRVGLESGMRLLDIGCGSGLAARIAADRGATVAGIDASAALVQIARSRVPGADLRVGEMETLPFDDRSFDVVAGFNSFQYAAQPVNALREAGRVARRGARIVVLTWGDAKKCQAAAYLAALGACCPRLRPAHPDRSLSPSPDPWRNWPGARRCAVDHQHVNSP